MLACRVFGYSGIVDSGRIESVILLNSTMHPKHCFS